MNKMIAILLIALMLSSAAMAETPDTHARLEGMVVGVTEDGGYLIDAPTQGEVQVNIDEESHFDAATEINVGDYLYIDYDGKMTRSLPPQVTADAVRMYSLSGDIVEVLAEENAILMNTEQHGEVYVTLPEGYDPSFIDFTAMTVYFNGAMTMSLPAQINAGRIVPHYALQGEVTEIAEETLTLNADGQDYQVNLPKTLAIPETMKAGDVIRVIFNGQMTRSIPAQITAMELIQVSK